MQQVRMNFFQQIYYAIIKPKQYYRLTKVSGGRLTGFVFLFTLIISLFTIIPMFNALVGPNGFTQYLRDDLPDFEMSNGELYVSGVYEYEDNHTYIYINTEYNEFNFDDIDRSYDQVMLISRNNMIHYQSYGRLQETDFSDLRVISIDNETIEALIPFLYGILVIVAIFIYLFTVAGYYLSALLYSLVGLVTSSSSRAGLTYFTLFKTAIYSKVTSSILFALVEITPIILPRYARFGISVLITCAYVVFGTLSHNSDDAYQEAGIPIPPKY